MATLTSVRKTIFNPLLQTKEQIVHHLQHGGFADGTAHPFKKTLLLLHHGRVIEISLSGKDDSFFLSTLDISTLSETIAARVDRFSADLEPFKSYEILPVSDTVLDVPLDGTLPTLIALSTLYPTYYDFCLGNSTGAVICWCSTTQYSMRGCRHSGDISKHSTLLHTITLSRDLFDDAFAVFVSGYSRTPLFRFQEKNPAIMICDHAAKIMYVVPVPLDEATIGKATLCAPVIGRKSATGVCFNILPTAVSSDGEAAATMSGDFLQRALARDFTDVVAPKGIDDTNMQVVAPAVSTQPVQTDTEVQIEAGKPMFIVEEGILPSATLTFEDALHVFFSRGISLQSGDGKADGLKATILPCVLGTVLDGPLVACLGQPFRGPNITLETYHELFERASFVLFHVSDRMTDQARLLNSDTRCNAIFILVPSQASEPDGNSTIEDILNEVNINAVTALAGPQSVVLVRLGDRYFYYRGIRWPGLFPETIKFGADVTEHVDMFARQGMSKIWKPHKIITSLSQNQRQILFKGAFYTANELYATFTTLSLDQLVEYKSDILDTLVQLQVVVLPKDVASFTSKLTLALTQIMNISFAKQRSAYLDNFKASEFKQRDARLLEQYKFAERQAKARTQWLIDALAGLISMRTTSARKHDLKTMIRKQTIAGNVAASKTMDYDAIAVLFEQHCAELGVVIANVNSNVFSKMLSAASEQRLLGFIATSQRFHGLENVCRLDDRVQYLCGLDAGIVLPMSQDEHSGPLSGEDTAVTLAFPHGLTNGSRGSAFAFPCYDQFIGLDDPYDQFWLNLTNEAHISVIRILQRSTIVSATQARRLKIESSSKDVGLLLIYCLTDVMQSLAATRTTPPAVGDASDTTTKIMRSLFGYLLTYLAAGTRPASMAWQLVSNTSHMEVPANDELWLYCRVIKLFAYTAWPDGIFKDNIRALLAKLLRKIITDPVTNDLRKETHTIQAQDTEQQLAKRNAQLKWLELATHVLGYLLSTPGIDAETCRSIATRALDVLKKDQPSTRRSITRFTDALEQIKISGMTTGLSDEVKQSAANTYAKRSAALRPAKSAVLTAIPVDPAVALTSVDAQLQPARKAIAEKFSVAQVHMQNEKAFTTLAGKLEALGSEAKIVSKKDLGPIKGDAELKRVPWHVGAGKSEGNPLMSRVPYILTGSDAAEVTEQAAGAGHGAVQVLATPTDAEHTLATTLRAMTGGAAAANMADALERMDSVVDIRKFGNNVPSEEIVTMLHFVIGEEVDAVAVLRDMCLALLEGWKDPAVGEALAVEVLKRAGGV